jgi:hypothetical protein
MSVVGTWLFEVDGMSCCESAASPTENDTSVVAHDVAGVEH